MFYELYPIEEYEELLNVYIAELGHGFNVLTHQILDEDGETYGRSYLMFNEVCLNNRSLPPILELLDGKYGFSYITESYSSEDGHHLLSKLVTDSNFMNVAAELANYVASELKIEWQGQIKRINL